jgi:uncharacterized OB-fold protein
MTELEIQRCERCGMSAFPDRLWCPVCGADQLHHTAAGPGRVEEETTLRRSSDPVRLGTVRLQAGPLVVARLAAGAETGSQVRLDRAPEGAICAHGTPD